MPSTTKDGSADRNFSDYLTSNYDRKCHPFLSEKRMDAAAICDIFSRAHNDVIVVIITIIINTKRVRGPGAPRDEEAASSTEEEGLVAGARVFRKTPLSPGQK